MQVLKGGAKQVALVIGVILQLFCLGAQSGIA